MVNIEPDSFSKECRTSQETLEEKEDVLIPLKQVLSTHPRGPSKQRLAGTRKERSSSGHAGQCVSTIRLFYEKISRRTAGIRNEVGRGTLRMAAITISLQKLDLLAKEPRPPIFPQHVQDLWDQFNIEGCVLNRLGFALVATCWCGGCCRKGYVFSEASEWDDKDFDPSFFAHRGRVSAGVQTNREGAIVFSMMPVGIL